MFGFARLGQLCRYRLTCFWLSTVPGPWPGLGTLTLGRSVLHSRRDTDHTRQLSLVRTGRRPHQQDRTKPTLKDRRLNFENLRAETSAVEIGQPFTSHDAVPHSQSDEMCVICVRSGKLELSVSDVTYVSFFNRWLAPLSRSAPCQ